MKQRTTNRHCRKLRKNKTRKGGARLAEGEYGFITYPAIPCAGRNTSKMVSKVFKSPKNMSEKHKERHKPFDTIKAELLPVVTRLKEVDPEQKKFIYPDFCDSPGDLTDEHRADGVDDENKYFSYLMAYSEGMSIQDSFGVFNHLLNAALYFYDRIKLAKRKARGFSNNSNNEEEKAADAAVKELLNKIYTAYEPYLRNLDAVVRKMHDAGIMHYDLHPGNVMIDWEDPKFGTWLKHMYAVYKQIRSTPKFQTWISYVGDKKDFMGYEISAEEKIMILGLLDELLETDTSAIWPRIIDWDSARIESKEDMEDAASDEYYDLIGSVFPSVGPARGLSGRFMDSL